MRIFTPDSGENTYGAGIVRIVDVVQVENLDEAVGASCMMLSQTSPGPLVLGWGHSSSRVVFAPEFPWNSNPQAVRTFNAEVSTRAPEHIGGPLEHVIYCTPYIELPDFGWSGFVISRDRISHFLFLMTPGIEERIAMSDIDPADIPEEHRRPMNDLLEFQQQVFG